jgi:hypothetical protein
VDNGKEEGGVMEKAVFKMLFPDKCWHEPWQDDPIRCRLCDLKTEWVDVDSRSITWHPVEQSNPNLLSWEGFGLLWPRAQEMEWWYDFNTIADAIFVSYVNPQRFLEALYNFGVETGRIKEG